MQVLADFLNSIGSAIGTAFQFLVDTVEGIAFVVQLTAKFLVSLPTYFGWMPVQIKTLVIMIFSIAVTYKIIGREG